MAGFPALSGFWQGVLAAVAVLTMTGGNLIALAQSDVKRMMGYSSIAHAGYVLAGLVVFTPESLSAALYYLLTYVFANLGIFGVVILVSTWRGGEEVTRFRGLGREAPAYAIALTLFFLSFVGIPPRLLRQVLPFLRRGPDGLRLAGPGDGAQLGPLPSVLLPGGPGDAA